MARVIPRNLLVLDEPTNHMDMRSKDILKNAIMKYDGTLVVIVSHDREFLDGMVQKVYEFQDGGVKEYLGGIYYFLEKRKLESLQDERRDTQKPAPAGNSETRGRRFRQTHLRAAQGGRRCASCAGRSRGSRRNLPQSKNRSPPTMPKFAAATAYDEADYKAYNDLKARYDHQQEWEKASYELELVEEQ